MAILVLYHLTLSDIAQYIENQGSMVISSQYVISWVCILWHIVFIRIEAQVFISYT